MAPAAAYEAPHLPAVHVRVAHIVSVPGQVAAVTHPAHAPWPSHVWVPPHEVPAGATVSDGVPATHTPGVHGLLLAGTSVLAATLMTVPIPLQVRTWQSPAVWLGVTVPAAANEKPHLPPVHVRVSHAVSCPGQVAAVVHPVHAPWPSQVWVPPHGVLATSGGFDGVPAVQRSAVQGLLSTGTSVLSTALTTLPAPSHSST
jgi:hypothetical protein